MQVDKNNRKKGTYTGIWPTADAWQDANQYYLLLYSNETLAGRYVYLRRASTLAVFCVRWPLEYPGRPYLDVRRGERSISNLDTVGQGTPFTHSYIHFANDPSRLITHRFR